MHFHKQRYNALKFAFPRAHFKMYIHIDIQIAYRYIDSNHPPSVLKHIPKMVEKRLQSISSDEAVFNNAKLTYEEALKSSGFETKLVYKKNESTTRRRSRKRKIIWFNPPYCQSVETNVARKFLLLVDKHFPPGHELRKIFNRNTLKVS